MQREAKLHGLAKVFSFEFSYLPASSIDGALSVFQFVKGGFISHIILLCVFACFIICVMNEKDNTQNMILSISDPHKKQSSLSSFSGISIEQELPLL